MRDGKRGDLDWRRAGEELEGVEEGEAIQIISMGKEYMFGEREKYYMELKRTNSTIFLKRVLICV